MDNTPTTTYALYEKKELTQPSSQDSLSQKLSIMHTPLGKNILIGLGIIGIIIIASGTALICYSPTNWFPLSLYIVTGIIICSITIGMCLSYFLLIDQNS